MKDAWTGLKVLTGQNKARKACSLTSTAGAADRLNQFYSRFDNKDFSNIDEAQRAELENIIDNEEMLTISKEEVFKVLQSININKATGPDKLSGRLIKNCITSLHDIIHNIYNISLYMCKMPRIWKLGEIIPVNKKPLPKVDNDLRPVTLTAVLAKCFERTILPKISNCTKTIMDNLQFAYISNRSTDDAIITLIHELTQHLDKGSNYARCLFIDYSSAFNTMQPHILINRLAEYNVPARLQLLILDFLTNRQQYVRTEAELSSTITINTGAPQGCVLSAFLFIIYTNNLSLCTSQCKIIKYADDTIVIGLIKKENEDEYRNTISYVSEWCSENYLDLNVGKTKELVFDNRQKQNIKEPVNINNSVVKIETKYKYLGVTIQDNLKWDEHVQMQVKKANKRMYHVRCLIKLSVDNEILSLFFNSVVSSVLVYGIAAWFDSCDKTLKKEIKKFAKNMCKINGMDTSMIDQPEKILSKQFGTLTTKICKDTNHPLHQYVSVLPHGRLRMLLCKTSRFRNSFLPCAVKRFNSN